MFRNISTYDAIHMLLDGGADPTITIQVKERDSDGNVTLKEKTIFDFLDTESDRNIKDLILGHIIDQFIKKDSPNYRTMELICEHTSENVHIEKLLKARSFSKKNENGETLLEVLLQKNSKSPLSQSHLDLFTKLTPFYYTQLSLEEKQAYVQTIISLPHPEYADRLLTMTNLINPEELNLTDPEQIIYWQMCRHKKTIHGLKKAGFNIDAQEKNGMSLLPLFVGGQIDLWQDFLNKAQTIELLLELGADATVQIEFSEEGTDGSKTCVMKGLPEFLTSPEDEASKQLLEAAI